MGQFYVKWPEFGTFWVRLARIRQNLTQNCPEPEPLSVKLTHFSTISRISWFWNENSEVFQPTYIWQTKTLSICICPWEWYHVFILEKELWPNRKSGLSKKSRFWYWPKLCPFQTIDSFYSLVTSRTKKRQFSKTINIHQKLSIAISAEKSISLW